MKKIFYILVPIIAFSLVLSNAFFGHLIFGLPYDQDINKYSIYVHLESNWNSNPGNILFDITNVWSNPDPKSDQKSYSLNPSDISSLSDYNQNQVQYLYDKTYVELKHEFSNCETNWKPILYRYAIDTIRNKIEMIQGKELSDDPYISQFPNEPNTHHTIEQHKAYLKEGYIQFIPICTIHDTTSYDYAVSLNDKNIAFDVFFVPAKQEAENYLSGSFEFYSQKGCFGENYHSFSGTCNDVSADAGLLVILPDNLEQSLTKVKISLYEKL